MGTESHPAMQNGMGVVPCWGNAPCMAMANSEGEAQNVLLIGSGEFGHILKTAATARLRDAEPVSVFTVEKHPETLARHCVLLACALDADIGLRERTELFLEIYGNAFLSPKGLDYVKDKAAQAARVISGSASEADGILRNAIDSSLLKHKELDEVLDILLQWQAGAVLDMDKYWDTRMRRYYQGRYDHRKNAADWDYHMKLKNMDASVVSSREFIKWRLHGIAFEFRDTSYTVPNITMGTWVEGRRKGMSIMARGFWSDIINSPYLSFGLQADNANLFKVSNREHVYTSCDISEYNVSQMLHALHTGETIQPKVMQSGMGSMGERPSEEELKAFQPSNLDPACPPLRIVLLLGDANKVLERSRYDGLFDAVLVSNLAAMKASTWLNKVVRHSDLGGHAIVRVETARYALDFKPEHKTEFVRRCYEAAREAEWLVEGTPVLDGTTNSYLTFVCSNTTSEERSENWHDIPVMASPVVDEQVDEKKPNAAVDAEGLHAIEAPEDDGAMQTLTTKPKPEGDAVDKISALTAVEVAVVQRNPDRITRRPRELLVKVRLPGLTSAAGVDVNVENRSVRVDHLGANLHAQTTLPFPVDGDKGSATFDTDTSLLILTLPVVAPAEQDGPQCLDVTETAPPNAEKQDGEYDEKDSNKDDKEKDDHVMLKLQNQKIGGMAIPHKLGANIMF